jgi:hypothetical protein
MHGPGKRFSAFVGMDMFRFKPVIMMVADMPNRGITVLPARPARPWTQAECIHRKQPLVEIVPCGHDKIPFGILSFGETNIPPGTIMVSFGGNLVGRCPQNRDRG